QKVIVLMTDGQNTWQFYLRDGYYDGPSNVWKTAEKVSSGWSSEYRCSQLLQFTAHSHSPLSSQGGAWRY
ncbi:MAG: hypothetical protein P8X69_08005, partial [Maritimibacter sp.]